MAVAATTYLRGGGLVALHAPGTTASGDTRTAKRQRRLRSYWAVFGAIETDGNRGQSRRRLARRCRNAPRDGRGPTRHCLLRSPQRINIEITREIVANPGLPPAYPWLRSGPFASTSATPPRRGRSSSRPALTASAMRCRRHKEYRAIKHLRPRPTRLDPSRDPTSLAACHRRARPSFRARTNSEAGGAGCRLSVI